MVVFFFGNGGKLGAVETQNTGTGGVRPKKENESNREGDAGLTYFLDNFFCVY
jgi:hypothetical protein